MIMSYVCFARITWTPYNCYEESLLPYLPFFVSLFICFFGVNSKPQSRGTLLISNGIFNVLWIGVPEWAKEKLKDGIKVKSDTKEISESTPPPTTNIE